MIRPGGASFSTRLPWACHRGASLAFGVITHIETRWDVDGFGKSTVAFFGRERLAIAGVAAIELTMLLPLLVTGSWAPLNHLSTTAGG